MKGSDNQEKLVYQIIEDAGNKGEHGKDDSLSLGLDLKCLPYSVYFKERIPLCRTGFLLSSCLVFLSGGIAGMPCHMEPSTYVLYIFSFCMYNFLSLIENS